MAMNLEELQAALNAVPLRGFIDSGGRPIVSIGMPAPGGLLQFIVQLCEEGTFLQFRTMYLCDCPATHPHVTTVHAVLAELNFRYRWLKFGWDRSDGEIAGYGDIWLMDTKVTPKQFMQMVASFITTVDTARTRILKTKETGQDPEATSPPDRTFRL